MMVQVISEFKPSHATLQQPATTSFCLHDRSDSYAKKLENRKLSLRLYHV